MSTFSITITLAVMTMPVGGKLSYWTLTVYFGATILIIISLSHADCLCVGRRCRHHKVQIDLCSLITLNNPPKYTGCEIPPVKATK